MKFRTPHHCQNGHFRWLYWEARAGDVINRKWGRKHPDCKCPTHEIGEGFAPCGADEQFTGLLDRHGEAIYEGDIVQRLPAFKYRAFTVKWSQDEGWSLPSEEPQTTTLVDFEVVGHSYEEATNAPA